MGCICGVHLFVRKWLIKYGYIMMVAGFFKQIRRDPRRSLSEDVFCVLMSMAQFSFWVLISTFNTRLKLFYLFLPSFPLSSFHHLKIVDYVSLIRRLSLILFWWLFLRVFCVVCMSLVILPSYVLETQSYPPLA